MSLRFIERDGKKILQEEVRNVEGFTWRDVPLVELKPDEPKWHKGYYCDKDQKIHLPNTISPHCEHCNVLLIDSRPVKALIDVLSKSCHYSDINQQVELIDLHRKVVEQLLKESP
jgi:hypothetical protein